MERKIKKKRAAKRVKKKTQIIFVKKNKLLRSRRNPQSQINSSHLRNYKKINHKIDRPTKSKFGSYFGVLKSRTAMLRPVIITAVVLLFITLSVILYQNLTLAVSDTYTVTTQAEWEAGEYWHSQLDTTGSSGDLKIASGGVGSWNTETPGFPVNDHGYEAYVYRSPYWGADLTTDGTYIYMIVGNNNPDFFRYNPELGTWKQLTDAPTAFYLGSSLAYYSGYIYAINGQDGSDTTNAVPYLFRYDIANDSWTQMADAPGTWGYGSDIISGNNGKLYAVKARAYDSFWSYDISSDTWADTLPTIPSPYQVYSQNGHPLVFSDVSYGSDPVYCESGCIYSFRGNNQRQFFRFDISLSQWYSGFSDIPSAIGGVHYGSAMAFDSVNGNIYATRGYNNDEFMKYDIDLETWDADTADTPDMPGGQTVYYGGSLTYLDGYVYALPANNRPEFIRYNISTGAWDSILTPAYASSDYDGDLMVFVPAGAEANCADSTGCLYVARGRNTNTFWRYDINDKTWTTLSTVTNTLQRGSSMCYDGNDNIYVVRARNGTDFYSYSISGDSWTSIGGVPAAVEEGGSITCIGDNDVYVLRGNYTNSFYRYNGSWTTETSVPVQTFYGAALTNDGTYVYALTGYYRAQFYRFQQGSGWTEMANLPEGSYYGAVMEYDGTDNIYAISGSYDASNMYRYDISADSWARASDMPAKFLRAQAMAHDDTNNVMYVRRGLDTSTIYTFNTEQDDYIPSATWISDTLDLTYATSFNSFSATSTTPGTTSITYYSRTSSDQVSWSSWQTITGGTTIQSTAARYIQIKIVLTSDNTNTPTVSDFTINYEKDSVNPTNPTATGYADSTKATSITTGNSYYHINPYFEFSGASDSESGLEGYYVSWTTNATHDPTSSEDYLQTGTTYTVNTDMTSGSTYYLRVAAKDQASNTASVQTLFTYTYNGISPASTKTWTVQADFEASGTSETNINTAAGSGTSMTLDSVTGGVWTQEAPSLGTHNYGSSLAYDGSDTLFVLRGTNTQNLYSYSISNKTYSTLANYGSNVYRGASMVYIPNGSQCADSSGCLFVTRGENTDTFQRYNVNADTWTTLNTFDGTQVYLGSSMAWDGSDTIYLTRGDATNQFWKYSISGDSWMQLTSLDQNVYYGGTLVYVPSGTYCSDSSGCLFATRGYSDADFYRYDVSSNSWTYLRNVPAWTHYGATSYYMNGYIYLIRGYAADDFYRYDIANDRWSALDKLPTTHYQTGSNNLVYVSSNDRMYTLRGYGYYDLLSYDVSEDDWKTSAVPHGLSQAGIYWGAVAYDSVNDVMYTARGNNTNDWWAYDITDDTWDRKADTPMRIRPGSDAEYIDHATDSYDGIYLLAGESGLAENEGTFWKYDIDTDLWTRLSNTPAETNYGSDLVYDGTDTIYTARGANTTTYYKYTISTDTWSTVSSAVPGTVYTGGCAVKANDAGTDYIYLTRGNNQDDIYRFNIGTETWDTAGTLSLAPGGMRYGDACVLDGQGNILIPRGDVANPVSSGLYVYDISADSWSTRAVLQYYEYGTLVMTSNNVVLGFRGEYTSTMERYVVATGSTGFEANGSWTSQVNDFGAGVYGFGGITLNATVASGTSLTIETRTCDDSVCTTPGSWTAVTNELDISGTKYYTVASSVTQYGQMRISFVSDQLYSPTINDVTWSYYSDNTAPTNPSSVSAYTDSGKGTSITDDTWTGDASPYFEWTASDNSGGIGVNGFYVYFGNDSTKDPITDASDATNLAYVSGTNFYSVESDGTTGVWDAATQAASSLTSDTYYLIIRTADYNSNNAASSGTLFTYKLDILGPTAPTGVSASPSGYSSTNSFSFSWTASSDTGSSGVSEYCYKTDGSDTCISAASTSISGITAYQSRGNTFSVRAKDTAGNYSSYATTTYYYAGSAPAAPQNLVASPTSQTNNNTFSFSWSLPESCLGQTPCDANDILRYCYTINELPSAANCGNNTAGNSTPSPDGGWTTSTQTTNRLLPGFSAATAQGTNTIYLVATDLINNIDYDNYASTTYTFTSTAPGPPASMQATDSSDRSSSRYSATLTWDEPSNLGDGVNEYNVYRCENDCDNPSAVDEPPDNYTNIASVTTLGYLDTGLDNTVTYSYFSRAVGSGNAVSGNSTVVDIKPEGKFKAAPTMSGQPDVTPRIRSAVIEWLTLNDQNQVGDVIPHPATSFVEYGLTSAYGSETGNSELVTEHSVTVTDLTPDTEYHYRAKWVDQDGNIGYSSDYTFTTKGAPSAPVNLAVTPESNTVNSFSFSWGAPTDEGVTVAGYRYSINNLPNEENVTAVTETSVGPIDAATQQGINTFYVVAIDDTGNINYSNYAAIEFEAYTDPPGEPKDITITDSSDRDAKRYSITITWDPPEGYTLEDEIYYTIYRKSATPTSSAAGLVKAEAVSLSEYEEIATITSTGYLDTGLDSTLEYSYTVTAKDKAAATSDPTEAVVEIPEGRYTKPPAITEAPVAVPDSFSAVVAWRTERVASSFVDFGVTSTDWTEEQGTAELVEDHSVKVTGLKPETKYYYQVKSIDIDENVAYSEVLSFTTLEAPRVLDVKITDVRLYDGIITWNTNKESTASIQYGTSANYGFTWTDTSLSYAYTHTVKLENLKDSTLYHLRIGGQDRNGNPISSDDYTFSTLTFPKISEVRSQNKAEGSTEIFWKTNVPTTSEVEYYNENIAPKTQGNTAMVTDHVILLYGLEDATRYLFKARGSDTFGYEAVSEENEFTTLEDTTPPEVFGIQSESNTIGSGEASKVQIVVSWKTDEPTTSQVEFGVGLGGSDYTDQTDENAELVMDHLVVVTDLAQAKTYHFRVVSRDKAGNETKSGSHTVLTSRERESFLQLIISNLETTFSWLGNINSLL